MDIVIVYYSYSGNTHQAAKMIAEILKYEHSVRCLRIEAPNESDKFFVQALRGITKRKIAIAPIETDLSPYDLIIFGTPVWAAEMAPAMRSYLEKAAGLNGKKALAFTTYGSGLGKAHCLDSLQRTLEKKGVRQIRRFSLSQFEVSDQLLLEDLLRKAMD
jgi:flavodoxin